MLDEGEQPQQREHWASILGFRLWFCIFALIAGIVVPSLLLLEGAVRVTSIVGFGLVSIAFGVYLYAYIVKKRL